MHTSLLFSVVRRQSIGTPLRRQSWRLFDYFNQQSVSFTAYQNPPGTRVHVRTLSVLASLEGDNRRARAQCLDRQKRLSNIKAPQSAEGLTPMMKQYLSFRDQYPGYLLLFRMGDFYECFYEDAVRASQVLGIALTSRTKRSGPGSTSDGEVPMAGIPFHALDSYLHRLIKKGISCAQIEQITAQSSAEADASAGTGILAREVVRLVTPGTMTEEKFLNPKQNNFLLTVRGKCDAAGAQTGYVMYWLDLSTGKNYTAEYPTLDGVRTQLAIVRPSEVVVSPATEEEIQGTLRGMYVTLREDRDKQTTSATSVIAEAYGADELRVMNDFGLDKNVHIAETMAFLLGYVRETQCGRIPVLSAPETFMSADVMTIDPFTRRSLELVETQSGHSKGSLLSVLDATVSAAGSRLLAARLSTPLMNLQRINARLDAAQYLQENRTLRLSLREAIRGMYDLDRALQRIQLQRGSPRDLMAIKVSLYQIEEIRSLLESSLTAKGPRGPPAIRSYLADLGDHTSTLQLLQAAIVDDPPNTRNEGGFIRPGFNSELDEIRDIRDHARDHIRALQDQYRTDTDVKSLKIKYNNALGYYIEVPSSSASAMTSENFHHRQTMANSMRYKTPELIALEEKIMSAAHKAVYLEENLFSDICEVLLEPSTTLSIKSATSSAAKLDVAAGTAEIAQRYGYCRPTLTTGIEFAIHGGRHPVVEAIGLRSREGTASSGLYELSMLSNTEDEEDEEFMSDERSILSKTGQFGFRANDCALPPEKCMKIITGANMAGKSTYLRQNALIVIMAQAGLYVPAERVTLGVVDQLFSRVGAADDLANDRSTFMVEMEEMAHILNHATNRSFVIVDELGRGTSTHDGLAIAWATMEHIHCQLSARSLFATHFHELAEMAANAWPTVALNTMAVDTGYADADSAEEAYGFDQEPHLAFTYRLVDGIAQRSYGIHVAALAGMPTSVVKRAADLLERIAPATIDELETHVDGTKMAASRLGAADKAVSMRTDDTPMRVEPLSGVEEQQCDVVGDRLREIVDDIRATDVDSMAPREALQFLYELRDRVREVEEDE